MLRTSLRELLGIEHPIVQPGMGPWTNAELVAAVSNAGGLGVLGASGRPLEETASQLKKVKQLTNRPFGLNWVLTNYPEGIMELPASSSPIWSPRPSTILSPLSGRLTTLEPCTCTRFTADARHSKRRRGAST